MAKIMHTLVSGMLQGFLATMSREGESSSKVECCQDWVLQNTHQSTELAFCSQVKAATPLLAQNSNSK